VIGYADTAWTVALPVGCRFQASCTKGADIARVLIEGIGSIGSWTGRGERTRPQGGGEPQKLRKGAGRSARSDRPSRVWRTALDSGPAGRLTGAMRIEDREPFLTTQTQAFMESLEPGDLLLFDSLKSLSGLVQWADAAPVNHVGLWAGEDTFIHANSDGDRAHAVKVAQLTPLLANKLIHVVVALRHVSADAPARARSVQVARQYVGGSYPFAEVELVLLGPLALIRAYSARLGKLVQWILGCGAKLWWELLQRRQHRLAVHEFTCSAFIMECLGVGGLEVDVDCAKPGQGYAPEFEANREMALAEMGKQLSGGTEDWELAAWRQLRTANTWRRATAGPASVAGVNTELHPEAVSPGDLWRSKSFFQASVYINRLVGQLPQ